MEFILSNLLPFGNVTVTVLGLLLLLLLLAVVYQIGIFIISITLALDDHNAPDIKMDNKVLYLLSCFVKRELRYKTKIEKFGNRWVIPHGNCYYDRQLNDTWCTYDYIKKYCVFPDKESALSKAKEKFGEKKILSFNTSLMMQGMACLLSVDIVLLLLQYQFFYTTLTLGITLLVYGIRSLAKMVYKNTKHIKGHEGRIGKLEGEK